METRKLLYAIIDTQGQGTGRTDLRAYLRLFPGIDNAPLEVISYQDLAAIISSIDINLFQQKGEEGLQAGLLKYQQVNLAFAGHHTLVPLRFGLTADGREQVAEILERTYLQLRTLLNTLRGKVELVVHASWDLSQMLQEFAGQDAALSLAISQGEAGEQTETSPSTHGKQHSIQVGKQLFETAEAQKKTLSTRIHTHLSAQAMNSSEGVCQSQMGQGKEQIFNRSYLVEVERETQFDNALNQLRAEYEGTITFSCFGPLPAYSFVNLKLSQGNFEVIDQARKTLTLPQQATQEEIQASYRRLALAYHPDRHPEDSHTAERFSAVTHAYEIVQTYCQSLQRTLGDLPFYSFARDTVEKTFIAQERR